MISGLLRGRYLAYRLFIKEVRATYSQSRFGLLWDFIEPIVLAAVFVVLRRGNVINTGDISIPYPVFVVFGLMLWQTFTEAITQPLSIMQRSKTLLTQVKVPPEALLLSIVYTILVNSIFRVLVMLGIAWAFGTISAIGVIKFLVLYPSVILVGMAFGVFFAPFNVVYGDIGRAVTIALRPLLYASPIIFFAPGIKILAYFNAVNPIAIVVENLRSVATQNLFINFPVFAVTCILLTAIFLGGWFVFHLSVPILSDKL
ncbi:MAG: ABC transporter permease [Anaerolineae bacterium]|nr:ABC transporter permease [Anaerolineae bacterium]